MKRPSRLQLILAVVAVALLGLTIFLLFSYFSESSKTDKLKKDIQTRQTQINNLDLCDPNDKNMQLEECMNRVATNSSFPPEPYDNKEIIDAIIGVVTDARVELDTLSYNSQSGIVLGASTYTQDNYHLECSVDEGKGSSLIVLLELFEELRQEKYNTLLISNVQLPATRTEIKFDIGIVTQ